MRYHLSTLVVMTLVAGVLLGLNLNPSYGYLLPTELMERLGKGSLYFYGWPAPFAKQYQPDLIAAFTRNLRLFPFMVDLGFAAFLTLGLGWANERWLHFKAVLAQVRAGMLADPRK